MGISLTGITNEIFFLILEIFSTVEKFSLNIYKKRGYNKLQSK